MPVVLAPTEVLNYPTYYGFDTNYKAFLLGARQDSIVSQGSASNGHALQPCVRFSESLEDTIIFSVPLLNPEISRNFFGNVSFAAGFSILTFFSTSSQLSDTADFINNTLQRDPTSLAARKDIQALLNTIMSVPNSKLSKLEVSGGGMLSGNLFDAEKLLIQRGVFQIQSITQHFSGSANSVLQDSALRVSHIQEVESIYVSDSDAGVAEIVISLQGTDFNLSGLNITFRGSLIIESIKANWTGTYITMPDCNLPKGTVSGAFEYSGYIVIAVVFLIIGVALKFTPSYLWKDLKRFLGMQQSKRTKKVKKSEKKPAFPSKGILLQ